MVNCSGPSILQQSVHLFLIVSGYGTGSGTNRLACQIEILADMSCIDKDYSMCRLQIPPFHTIGYGCPDEDNRAFNDESLSEYGAVELGGGLLIKFVD